MVWFGIFVFATIYNLSRDVSDDAWATFWWANVVLSTVIGTATTSWFFFGGLHDVRAWTREKTLDF